MSNTISFGQGGKNLKSFEEDGPDDLVDRVKQLANDVSDGALDAYDNVTGDEESGNNHPQSEPSNNSDSGSEDGDNPTEQTSLLPHRTYQFAQRTNRRINTFANRIYDSLPKPAQSFITWISPFFNPALIGAVIGATIGLTPTLQRLFFNQTNKGGYLNAWLTTPIKNAGELFVTLQVLVVGVKLSLSLCRLKEDHEDAGDVPWRAVIFVTVWRFIVLPAYVQPFQLLTVTETDIIGSRI